MSPVRFRSVTILGIILLASTFQISTAAEPINSSSENSENKSLRKSQTTSDIYLDCNRMNGIFRNNGVWLYDCVLGDWGLEWPKGSGLSPIFAAGQFIGAKVNGEVRVAGVQHSNTEFQPGVILTTGNADNASDSKYRWYQLSSTDAADAAVWPADQGAPVDDNGDPLLLGDQTIYSVWNDLTEHSYYETNPLNAEVHQTAWAFNRSDAVGDMIFVKWTIINKSGDTWNDTYLSIWCDPDIGNAGDDYVGCDTTLGLGFSYNAENEDSNYGAAPPAIGFDFLQGPIVPGQSTDIVTLPDGTVLTGKKMLKMTSFINYNNDDSPQGNPSDGKDVYNYMNGIWRDDSPITTGGTGTDPSNPPTKFMFSGDPETASGWLDSNPADRRFIMSAGPFDMEPWNDTDGDGLADFGEPGVQEIVACIMAARGTTNLNSVTTLKAIDEMGQLVYDENSLLVELPKTPFVTGRGLPNEVVLTWDDRAEYNSDGSPYESTDPLAALMYGNTVIIDNTIKVVDDSTYNFYGYEIYQYSDIFGSDPVRIGYYNIGKNKEAVSYTKQRYFNILVNRNPEVGEVGSPIIDNNEYYFGVIAQAYLEFGTPTITNTVANIVKVKPVGAISGTDLSTVEVADTAQHLSGKSDGVVTIEIIDPSAVTGHTYNVTFNSDLTWNLTNTTDSKSVLINQTNQRGDDAYNIADGLLVKVIGPEPGINISIPGPYGIYENHMGYGVTNSVNRWVTWGINWGLETMGGAFGNGFSFFGSDAKPDDYVNIEIRFAGVDDWSGITDSSSTNLMAISKAQHADRWSKAVVYLRPSYTVQTKLADIPFVVWDTENNRQLKVAICEESRAAYGNNNFIWDMGWNGHQFINVNGTSYGGREYIFILNDTYDEQYTNYINGTLDGTYHGVLYAAGWTPRKDVPFFGTFDIQVYASHPNVMDDVFSFSTTAASHFDISKGDVNDDNAVNISDVITLINYILLIDDLTGEQEYAADVNNDLYLNVADVVGIINKILGRSKSLAKLMGTQEISFSLPQNVYIKDKIVSLPISLKSEGDYPGYQIELSYDPNLIRPVAPEINDANFTAVFGTPQSGKATYIFYNLQGDEIDPADLPELQFELLGSVEKDSIQIKLDNVVISDVYGQTKSMTIGNRITTVTTLPESYKLQQCYPNPFNAQTVIRYDLPEDSKVTLRVYNLMGQCVRTIINYKQPAGSYSIIWDSKNDNGTLLSSGIYLLQFKAGKYAQLQKMTLLK